MPAEDRPKLLMYLAEALFLWGREVGDDAALKETGELCVTLLKNGKGGSLNTVRYFALLTRVMAAEERVLLTPSGFDGVPQGAEVVAYLPRVDGSPGPEGSDVRGVPVYALSSAHEEFLAATDAYLLEFASARSVDETLQARAYRAAQVLFSHHHFEEARRRAREIIDLDRASESAGASARRVVESYSAVRDLEQVRAWTSEIIRNPVGPPATDTFECYYPSPVPHFQICLRLAHDGKRLEAAECFLDFIEAFPKSDYLDVALYNAANSYQLGGQASRANELFEQFVRLYPTDEKSAALYFRIASGYESVMELEQAIHAYERLVTLFPDNIDAAAAHYNAAYLKQGLGDPAGAAQGFEHYASRFPNESDIEAVFFSAYDSWEQVGPGEHGDFCKRYLRREDFDGAPARHRHQLLCLGTLADQAAAAGDITGEARWLDKAEEAYLIAVGTDGVELNHAARSVVARARLRDVYALQARTLSFSLHGDTEKDMQMLEHEALPAVVELHALIPRIWEVRAWEAQFEVHVVVGLAELHVGALVQSATCAAEPVLCGEKELSGAEAAGLARLTRILEVAATAGVHLEALDRAQAVLHERDPDHFHVPWAEIPAIPTTPQADELQGWVDGAHFGLSRATVE